jgi:hypothetical protein
VIDRERINEEVRALERLDLEGLRSAWIERYGGAAPKLRSRELLGLMLAWRIQAQAFGGLEVATRRKLKTETTGGCSNLDLAPGTVLTREWKGVPEKVRRTDAGYEWRGRTYKSLTAVARAISGGPRSGPLFFGLKEAA